MSFVYFTDRDLGKGFSDILRSAGLVVEQHFDHFPADAPDEVWLREIGRRGWIALTHDRHIRYKPNERDAVMQHGVGLLIVMGRAPLPELARAFVTTSRRVEHFLRRHKPPFIAKVYGPSPAEQARSKMAPGRVELWYPR